MIVEVNLIKQFRSRPEARQNVGPDLRFQTVCRSYQHKTAADKIIIILLKYNFIYFTNMPSVIPLNPKLNSLIKMERKIFLQEIKKENVFQPLVHRLTLTLNSYLASSDFCHLLITFANSLDPD